MHIPPETRSTSTMPHLGLMFFGLVCATLITFSLIIGWRWYFGEINQRRELARLSALADDNIAQVVAQQSARLKASTRAATTLPEPMAPLLTTPEESSKSGVSLTDLPRSQSDVVFTAPEPIAEDVKPDRLQAAIELQKQFWAAASWKDKLPFVAEGERVGPLMQDYYEAQNCVDPVAGNSTHQAHFKLNNTEVLLFSYSSARPSGSLDMALVATNGGKFVIDWESYVGACNLSWTEFKRLRSSEPKLFRVFMNQDDYYNYEFADEKRFMSFHLGSGDGFYFVKGFCERDSSIGATLSSLFASGAPRMAFTLRLAFPEKALSDHCVRIVGVVANRWLIVP